MLISKFNLYNDEWLDVVFAGRNKSYGAYELRKHHDRDTVRALLIALCSISLAAFLYGMAIKVKPAATYTGTIVEVPYLQPPPQKKQEIEKPKPETAKPAKPQTTKRFTPMVVTSDPVVEEPPTIDELKDAVVAQVDNKVEGAQGSNADVNDGNGTGPGTAPAVDNTVHGIGTVEKMPEPIGGNAAWSKFLQKNLKYPALAVDQGIAGKVFISFIIEKDGHLSNITLLKGPGFGLDEEALRVLKLAPAWRPGEQNGQNVRVKFTIPINFSLGE